MSVQVRRRREAASFLASFVGAQGELIVDTTNNRVQVHDGATPGGFAAAKLSEVVTNTRTAVADANYGALSSDRMIAYTAITAPRTVTLPAASTYPTGTPLLIVDESGASSGANTITLARASVDLINGVASATIASAFGFIAVESNGISRWTIVDQAASAAASTATIMGGTIDGTPVGATTRSSGAFTTLAVTSSLSLPANSIVNAALAQMPTLTLKANATGGTATPVDVTLSAMIDASQGSTRGALLFRGSSGWTALAPGTSGTILTSNGTGADPTYQIGGGAAALSVPTRQTVMGGPASSGVPSFLPASAASLVLLAQNVSSGTPLTLTASQGYGASGAANFVFQFTSNPSWTVPASTTSYLYVNAQTGVTGTTLLQPIYQFGGTLSTTNGQFTFDYQAMVGYLGNGTTAVMAPLVFVGECVAGASAITSTTAYAYNGLWEGPFVATLPTAGTFTMFTHNLGVLPDSVDLYFKNTTAENGYSVGDIAMGRGFVGAGFPMTNLLPTRNTLGWQTVVGQSYSITSKAAGSGVTMTLANWSYRAKAQRGW